MKKSLFIFILFIISFSLSAEVNHWIAPVYNFTRINTQLLNQYDFHSAGMRYSLLTNKQFGFYGSVGAYVPISYKSNGESGNIYDSYNIPINFDTFLGVGSTIPVMFNGEFTAGLGVYMQGIFLNHTQNERYYFDSLTAGFATDLTYHFLVKEEFNLGIGLMTGFNFLDLLHRGPDRLLNGATLNTSIKLGF